MSAAFALQASAFATSVSPPSPTATVVVSRLPVHEDKPEKALSSCTSLPKERERILREAEEEGGHAETVREMSLDAGTRTPLDFIALDGLCGATGNCDYTGYASVRGCLREIATVQGQPTGTVRDPRQSWPMLVTGWHNSAASAGEEIRDLHGGRYEVLNRHHNCDEGEEWASPEAMELAILKRRYFGGDDDCVYDAHLESDGKVLGLDWYRAH